MAVSCLSILVTWSVVWCDNDPLSGLCVGTSFFVEASSPGSCGTDLVEETSCSECCYVYFFLFLTCRINLQMWRVRLATWSCVQSCSVVIHSSSSWPLVFFFQTVLSQCRSSGLEHWCSWWRFQWGASVQHTCFKPLTKKKKKQPC